MCLDLYCSGVARPLFQEDINEVLTNVQFATNLNWQVLSFHSSLPSQKCLCSKTTILLVQNSGWISWEHNSITILLFERGVTCISNYAT